MKQTASCITNRAPLLFLLLLPAAAAAQMYKWVDENGTVTYSSQPPPDGTASSTVDMPPPVENEAAKARLEAELKALENTAAARREGAAEQRQAKAETENQARRCEQARSRLASLQYPRVNVPDGAGGMRVMAEEERQRELETARQSVQTECK